MIPLGTIQQSLGEVTDRLGAIEGAQQRRARLTEQRLQRVGRRHGACGA